MIDILLMTGTLNQTVNNTQVPDTIVINAVPGGYGRVMAEIIITIPKRRTSYFA